MVFFVRITVNQSHLRPICKSTKFNPKIQRTIYLINFQQLRLHVPDFIRTIVLQFIFSTLSAPNTFVLFLALFYIESEDSNELIEFHSKFVFMTKECDAQFVVFNASVNMLLTLYLILFIEFFECVLVFRKMVAPPAAVMNIRIPNFLFLKYVIGNIILN